MELMKHRDEAVEATLHWMDQANDDHRGALPKLKDDVTLNTVALTCPPWPPGPRPETRKQGG